MDDLRRIDEWLRPPGDENEVFVTLEEVSAVGLSGHEIYARAKTYLLMNEMCPDQEETDLLSARQLLWCAASMGHGKAIEALAEQIRSVLNSEWAFDRPEYRHWREIMEIYDRLWLSLNSDDLNSADEDARLEAESQREITKALSSLVLDEDKQDPNEKGRNLWLDEEDESHTEEDWHQILKTIGDSKSREGAEIAKRYERLLHPLPLKGIMPERGVVASTIAREWPWAPGVGQFVESALDVLRSVGIKRPQLKPLLLVGAPGTGKTALAQRLAQLLNLKSVITLISGSMDGAGLNAVSRGWQTARPSAPVMAASDLLCADPMIILDEVDKGTAVGSQNGSAAGTLLGMLGSPERYYDSCLLTSCDLTKMTFVATANSLKSIPEPLLDRFNILHVGRPGAEHFDIILSNMRRKKAAELGIHPELLVELDYAEREALRAFYGAGGASLRQFSRAFDVVLAEAVNRELEEMPRMMMC